MATHSSILAWRIPWTEEPGKLQSIVLHRVGHNWRDLAHIDITRVDPLSRPINNACFDSGHKFELSSITQGFPGGSVVKESARNAGDPGLIPGTGGSPEEGNGSPL